MQVSSMIVVLGLALDVMGAYLLARGIGGKLPGEIGSESSTAWGYNQELMLSKVAQKADSLAGFGFLFFGFFLQALSYYPQIRHGAFFVGGTESIVALALFIASASVFAEGLSCRNRRVFGRDQTRYFLQNKKNISSEGSAEPAASTIERLLGNFPRRSRESATEYLHRVAAELGASISG